MLAEFTGLTLSHTMVPAKTRVPSLDSEQRAQIQQVAGEELRRLGYTRSWFRILVPARMSRTRWRLRPRGSSR